MISCIDLHRGGIGRRSAHILEILIYIYIGGGDRNVFFFTTAKCVNKEALYLPEGSSIIPSHKRDTKYLSKSFWIRSSLTK